MTELQLESPGMKKNKILKFLNKNKHLINLEIQIIFYQKIKIKKVKF